MTDAKNPGAVEVLEPCPFCGCPFPVINRPIAGNVKLSVKCPSCHSHGGYGATEAEAIAAWNRRHPLPEHPQEGAREAVDALRVMLPLVKQITVRQAIEAGIADQIGLNPWAINEGLAGGEEPALAWWKIDSIEKALSALASSPPSTETKESGE